ncbi:MAG: polyprenyl diphosphate synthase [Candidatus Andersenbacteria bacterium]
MEEQRIPRHIAIVPDGNRRWAKEQGVSTYDGHYQGSETFRSILRHAADRGVRYMSMWGMSADNMTKRSPTEVAGLLKLFRDRFTELQTDSDIHERQIRIEVLGQWREKFPRLVRSAIEKAIEVTKDYDQYTCTFMLAYNGTDEMRDTIQRIVAAGIPAEEVTEEVIKEHLLTKDLPSVDLLIRTGGEPHNSAGFMMWDVADSQLHFTETLWPAFSPEDLDRALEEYAGRERRKGK